MSQDELNKIAIFRHKEIRRVAYGGEWWFVINDVIAALTGSSNPADYLKKIRRRDQDFDEVFRGDPSYSRGDKLSPPVKLNVETSIGKRKMYCWHTEGIFRMIQSIPSRKAEPFKRWLARVGFERVQEIENPELILRRHRLTYKLKGYDDDWIDRRIRGINTRHELTTEWDERGITTELEYSILTAEISKATFGLTPAEYKQLKGLGHENLRDHMDILELLFTELGEAATTEITRNDRPKNLTEHQNVARRGGAVAGSARRNLEQETGRKVVKKQNYLNLSQKTLKKGAK
jgi:prophage antirepressor-like protein